jgi:hypothetical protein
MAELNERAIFDEGIAFFAGSPGCAPRVAVVATREPETVLTECVESKIELNVRVPDYHPSRSSVVRR